MRAHSGSNWWAGWLVAIALGACGPGSTADVGGGEGAPDAGLPDAGGSPDPGTSPDGGPTPDAGEDPLPVGDLPAGCEAPPAVEGFPTPESTGVPAGVTLTEGGPLAITEDGFVLEGRDLAGTVVVEADDVVIRNTRITSNGAAVVLQTGATRLTLENVSVVGEGIDHPSAAITVRGGEITVRKLLLAGYAEGLFLDGGSGRIEASLFLCLPDIEGGDTIEVWAGHDLVIRNNRFDRRGGNSNIKFPVDVRAPGRDARIEGNLLAGGGWSVYGGYEPGDPAVTWSNVVITGNRFSVRHHEKSGYWGPIAFAQGDLTTGNVWHESGAPLTDPPPPAP